MSRRNDILEAALASYDETGNTAIEDVRRRSGASVGSIYHHFGGKDGIAAALDTEILRHYQRGFLRALRRAGDAEAGIKGIVRYHLGWVQRHPADARFLLHSGIRATEELRELNRALFSEVGDWVDRQAAIRRLDRDVFYSIVIGPAQEASRHWLGGRIRSLRSLEPELAEAAWRAIRT